MENKALQCPKCSGKEVTKRGLRITVQARDKLQTSNNSGGVSYYIPNND